MLKYLVAAILFAVVSTASFAKERAAEVSMLGDALVSMGYYDIRVDGCIIEFSHDVEPTSNNNGYFAYTRSINLNNLVDFSRSKVEEFESSEAGLFLLKSKFDSQHSKRHEKTVEFSWWVKRNFGSPLWPYKHPEYQDKNTPAIEYSLRSFFYYESELDRWTNYSKYGASTDFPSDFYIMYEYKEPLEELRKSIVSYSEKSDCAIDE